MNEYELLYVISPRLTAEDVDGMVERVGALIEGAGGSVSMVDNWGRRRLAYPIRHHFEGTYVLTYLNIQGERAAELERALNINEDILRHLLLSGVIAGYEGPPEQEVDMRRPTGRPSFGDRPPADEAPADTATEETEAAPAETPAAEASAPVAEAAPAETEAPAAEAPAEAAEAPAAEAASGETEAPAAAEAEVPAAAEAEAPVADAAAAETEAPPAAVAGAE